MGAKTISQEHLHMSKTKNAQRYTVSVKKDFDSIGPTAF